MASRRRAVEFALVLLIIAAACCRRLEYLTQHPFWVDEAESSINALTILERGVPVDRYLGIPIYENTLVKTWPGNPEYEFKDISYSDRGLATYHGWLPLYSIAASFALHRVAPDQPANANRLHRTLAELKRRSWIGRLPSVFFSAVFLALCYWGGLSLMGRDAGLTALLVGCVHQTQLDVSTTARYYSATVALSTAAVLCLWFILAKGQWKHYVIGAGVFALLFYTHLVTFAAGIFVLGVVVLYLLWRKRTSIPKLLVFGGLLLSMTVPWILATGFLSGLGSVPPARSLLSFPQDLLTFPLARLVYFIVLGAFLLAVWGGWLSGYRFPDRVKASLRQFLPPAALLSLWIVSGYASFMLLIPAASFFPERLNLSYWGPALLLGSVFCAGLSRMLTRSSSVAVSPLLAFLLLGLTGHDLRARPSSDEGHTWQGLTALAGYLDRQEFPSTTRFYASPNEHLTLAFYTGRPFQSIAPVRKSFLNTYPGDIVYVERAPFLPATVPLPVSDLVRTLPYRHEVDQGILGVSAGTPIDETVTPPDVSIPIFRGYQPRNWHEWRTLFFYRFADPASRGGIYTNYAERLRGSKADLLIDANWVIYYSRFHDLSQPVGVDFRIMR